MFVFKAIKPAIPFKSSVFRAEINAASAKVAAGILSDFEKTTRTWEHEVTFKTKTASGAATGGASVEVKTTDAIYGYVDEGTKPHLIKPKRRGYPLRFATGGRAKTKPRVIGSTAGRRGNKEVRAMVVRHPGTKARQFSKVIQKKWQPEFRKAMDAALRRAAKKSGHSATR